MTEQQLIDAIHQAKLDYQAAEAINDTVAMNQAQSDSANYKQQLHDLRNPAPPPLTLAEEKTKKIVEIDVKTQSLIAQGVTYDSKTFSMSANSQMNWTNLFLAKDILTFPVEVTTKNNETYSIADITVLTNFYATGIGVVKAYLDSGRALKVLVNAATTIPEVQAVADNR